MLGKKIQIISFSQLCRHKEIGRQWFVSRQYGGCQADAGWMMVSYRLTEPTYCTWERPDVPKPTFLYSRKNTYTKWFNDTGKTIEAILLHDIHISSKLYV